DATSASVLQSSTTSICISSAPGSWINTLWMHSDRYLLQLYAGIITDQRGLLILFGTGAICGGVSGILSSMVYQFNKIA
ncbi:MAG TPA: hypothetical protein VMH01_05500, partial [Puia sp.]|nr:hypothetical protein [Puia sp.]